MGSRSRRAPESAVTGSSLFPREQGQAAFRQGIDGETAVLVKGVLLGVEKKVFAAAHGPRVKAQDALDEGVGFRREAIGGADLGDQTNLQRAMGADRVTEQNEGKSEAREGVLTEIGQDGDGGKTVTHLGKSEGGVFRDERKVAQNGEAESEAEGVALDFGDADQGRGTQGGLELQDASRLTADSRPGERGALASGAKNSAASANAQDPRRWF